MTEAEWLGADSPLGMLAWLAAGSGPSGHYARHLPVSDRKLRLFACACCRAVWHLLSDKRSRRAVEAAERLADGRGAAAVADLNAASLAVGNWAMDHDERVTAARAAYYCLARPRYSATVWEWLSGSVPGAAGAVLLREVVGNPFRPATLDPAMPNWCEITGLAEAAYDERRALGEVFHLAGVPCRAEADGRLDPARLAVLADALEDAGCAEEALLHHLRGRERCPDCFDGPDGARVYCRRCRGGWVSLRGPHYRGCWALDLVLGLS